MTGFALSEARLGGRRILAQIDKSMVDLSLEETARGASSVKMTVRDASLALVRSGILVEGIELVAWGRTWVLVGEDDSVDRSLGFVFESKTANDLKNDFRRLSMKRSTRLSFTRAILGAVRPRVTLLVPDERRVGRTTISSMGAGIAPSATIKIRGKAATREQRVAIDAALGEAWRLKASVATMRALIAVMITESSAVNLVAGSGVRGGILRMPSDVGTAVDARDMRAIAAWFVGEAEAGTAATIAANVMHRATSTYTPHVAEASAIVTTFNRGRVVTIAKASALVAKHLTQKLTLGVGAPQGEAGESRWDAIQRVWTELGWYVYELGTQLVIMSGQHVRVAKPDATIRPDDAGVLEASCATDEGFRVGTASFTLLEQVEGTLRAGMVVDVVDYGKGSGRYVIVTLNRSTGVRAVSVELETPTAVVAAQNQAGPARDRATAAGTPDSIAAALKKAEWIDAQRYPYVKGGGHNAGFTGPYDCSGAVSAVLKAAGVLSAAMATGGLLNSWGKNGKGTYCTVWVKDSPGNPFVGSHTFLQFHGHTPEWFGTSGQNPGGGAGFFTSGDTSGMTARHVDGM